MLKTFQFNNNGYWNADKRWVRSKQGDTLASTKLQLADWKR